MSQNGSSRRWLGLLVGTGFFLFALLACDLILGIDPRPARSATDGASADVSADGGALDDAACALESRGCSAACPHDFCADFDVDGQALDLGFTAPITFTNPLLKGDSGLEIRPGGRSPPYSLHVAVGAPSSSSFAMLAHQLSFEQRRDKDRQVFDGVRVAIDVQIDALSLREVGGGPVKDGGSGALLGLLRPTLTGTPKGMALLVTDGGFFLSVSEDILGGAGEGVLSNLGVALSVSSLTGNSVRIELFVGTRDRAITLGYASCPQPASGGLVAGATFGGGLGRTCVEIPPTFDVPAGPKSWAEAPVLLIGGLLFAAGSAEYREDNVVADFYAK